MKIESYSFGSMKIIGREYTAVLLVYREEIGGSWWREKDREKYRGWFSFGLLNLVAKSNMLKRTFQYI